MWGFSKDAVIDEVTEGNILCLRCKFTFTSSALCPRANKAVFERCRLSHNFDDEMLAFGENSHAKKPVIENFEHDETWREFEN